MTDSDQKEFLELLGDLYGAHGQNVKANIASGAWRGLKHMTLGEFRAVVTESLDRLQFTERGASRPPGVSEIWDLHRELRRGGATETTRAEQGPKFDGDGWSVNANIALLAHVTRAGAMDYAPDSRGYPVHPGPHTEAIAKILSKWKNAWARDMREDRELYEGKLDGKATWLQYMLEADTEVRAYLQRYVNPAEAA